MTVWGGWGVGVNNITQSSLRTAYGVSYAFPTCNLMIPFFVCLLYSERTCA